MQLHHSLKWKLRALLKKQAFRYVANDYDLLCVTSRFSQDLKPRIIQVGGLISGINEEKVRKEIKDTLVELANE